MAWTDCHPRNHLAPISGSIGPSDASPLAAAWREIVEETTLDPSALTFLRHGKSYTFADPSVGREWTICPFAFALKPPTAETESRIAIDWEHTSWAWHDPSSVTDDPSFHGVPRLAESLRRVWFENDLGPSAGAILSSGLRSLATDNVSGARQMAGSALRILRETIVAFSPCAPTEEWWSVARMVAWHLVKNGRESMSAAIQSALLAALSDIEKRMATHPRDEKDSFLLVVTECIDDVLAQRTQSATTLFSSLADFLTSGFPPSPSRTLSLLTLSESSTITHALLHLARSGAFAKLDIRILESRPLLEGVSLAASLASANTNLSEVRITIHTDASAALASHGIDVVMLGADCIASSGAVSNKTGSLPAVLSARYVTSSSTRAKIVVLSDTDKITPPRSASHVVEDGGAEPMAAAWTTSQRLRVAADRINAAAQTTSNKVEVVVRNLSFEWVPAELVDVYLTERGKWTVDDIARHAEGLRAEEERIFGGL
jgi:translation initiation factor 2B subunit (eIF-2B alpha/beta/delta family)